MSGPERFLYAKHFSFLTLAGDATRAQLQLSHVKRKFIGGFKGCLTAFEEMSSPVKGPGL